MQASALIILNRKTHRLGLYILKYAFTWQPYKPSIFLNREHMLSSFRTGTAIACN